MSPAAGDLSWAGLLPAVAAAALSGLYTSAWGAFKDSPWEGYKPRTFPRSILFSLGILGLLVAVPPLRERVLALDLVPLFFLVMGLERFLTELYKGCFREEPQDKYFVPSELHLLGRPVPSRAVRVGAGVVLVAAVFAVLFLAAPVTAYWQYLVVAYLTGLLVSGGGAWKDAPFEGFHYLKFHRSGLVLAIASPFFYWLRPGDDPVALGILVYMNGGLERFLVEYYKTYIQRNMSGKFRPDLPRVETRRREELHVLAWVLIVGVVAVALFEAGAGS